MTIEISESQKMYSSMDMQAARQEAFDEAKERFYHQGRLDGWKEAKDFVVDLFIKRNII